MKTNEPQFWNIPKHYVVCYHDGCSLAKTCLRRIAAQSGKLRDPVLTAVNPTMNGGTSCKYYRENKSVTMAYGMQQSFDNVKSVHVVSLRKTIKSYFGNGSYYLRRNGKVAITPEEQQFIAAEFSSLGYKVKFDRMEELTQWE